MKIDKNFPTFQIKDHKDWEILNSLDHYKNEHIHLRGIKTYTPTRRVNNSPVDWIIAHRKNAAVVAPQLKNGNFILIKQERIPIKRTMWEFVAGQIDDTKNKFNQETIINTAIRELQEESGYEICKESGELINLGYFFSSQGFTDEHSYLFLAKNVVESSIGITPDDGEGIIEIGEFSFEEITDMINKNQICDANSLSMYSKLCIFFNKYNLHN